jgi:hypothetical protein
MLKDMAGIGLVIDYFQEIFENWFWNSNTCLSVFLYCKLFRS